MAAGMISSDAVKSLFDTASGIFGKDIKELLESDAAVLKRTDVSQPAITAANLAAAAYLGEKGFHPCACAGFSLGEYAALTIAGVISAADCLRLVKARGEIMQQAADNLPRNGDEASGMAAVVGIAPERAESLIAEWTASGKIRDLYAANINSPKQLVVSGTAAALTQSQTLFMEAGAKRFIRLQVAGPFHSPLMEEARKAFLPVLETISFSDPVIPVFSNVTGGLISSGTQAKELASIHITSPVRWIDEEAAAAKLGVDACLEAGPGNVLQGLWRDFSSVYGGEINVFAAGTAEDINSIIV